MEDSNIENDIQQEYPTSPESLESLKEVRPNMQAPQFFHSEEAQPSILAQNVKNLWEDLWIDLFVYFGFGVLILLPITLHKIYKKRIEVTIERTVGGLFLSAMFFAFIIIMIKFLSNISLAIHFYLRIIGFPFALFSMIVIFNYNVSSKNKMNLSAGSIIKDAALYGIISLVLCIIIAVIILASMNWSSGPR